MASAPFVVKFILLLLNNLHFCQKLVGHTYMDLFLDGQFCFIVLCVSPLTTLSPFL